MNDKPLYFFKLWWLDQNHEWNFTWIKSTGFEDARSFCRWMYCNKTGQEGIDWMINPLGLVV